MGLRKIYQRRQEKFNAFERFIRKQSKVLSPVDRIRQYIHMIQAYTELVRSGRLSMPTDIPWHIVEYKRKLHYLFAPYRQRSAKDT